MKQIILILAYTLLVSVQCQSANNIPLDSIKSCLVLFLKEVQGDDYSSDDLANFLFIDRKEGNIQEGKKGIFSFNTLSSVSLTHFLLVDKDSFQILNMKEPLDQNVLKLIHFFEKNKQYSREDLLFYMKDFIETYQLNEEYLKSFNGLIK